MDVHLVDGTFELFRHHYGAPPHVEDGRPVGAVRGVCRSLVRMLEDGATHVGVATDHVIESFRNDLWPGYKTGAGIDPELWQQFGPLEDALAALGFTVWPMVEHEADDALASAARRAAADAAVTRVVVCTPDKDLAQCVEGDRVVQFDRRGEGRVRTEPDVMAAYGVPPRLIPDWLGLMGDSADGFPGLPGFGAKSAAAVVNHFGGVASIPTDPAAWGDVAVRGAARLAATFAERHDEARLFTLIATLVDDLDVGTVASWRWTGPGDDAAAWCARIGAPEIPARLEALATARRGA